jgi:uridine kinase
MRLTLKNPNCLLEACRHLSSENPDRPILIGIDGRSGSGKSVLGAMIQASLSNISIPTTLLHFDRFWIESKAYRALLSQQSFTPDQAGIGYHYDWLSFKTQVLAPLRGYHGNDFINNPWVNSFIGDQRSGLCPSGAIIIEGFSINRLELREYFDLSIFVDLDKSRSFENAIGREGERERTYYTLEWNKIEDEYISQHCPQKSSDFVVKTLLDDNAFHIMESRA